MTTLTIAKREFGAFFKSPIAYIVLSVFLILTGFFFYVVGGFFAVGEASMERFFSYMPFILIMICPAIAMRLIAEERGSGTIELLLTMPVGDSAVVVGKYLAALACLIVGLVLTLPYAVIVGKLGPMDTGPVIASYFGTLLLGGTYLAIGIFASATTKNQIIAYLIGLAISMALFGLGSSIVTLPNWIGPTLQYMSPQYHFEKLARGVIELRDVVYYLSIIGVMLLASVQILESRKWRR